MRQTLCGIAALLTLTPVLLAEIPEAIPSFCIEAGDAVKAEVRLYVGALTNLHVNLGVEKGRSYMAFVRKYAGQKTRTYVCGELLAEAALPESYAQPECTFLVTPQQGLDLAVKLVTKPGGKRSKNQ